MKTDPRLDALVEANEAVRAYREALGIPELPSPANDETFRVWWHVLCPDRRSIATEIDRAARDYDRADMREAAMALRNVARWIRASAGEAFSATAPLNGGSGVSDD